MSKVTVLQKLVAKILKISYNLLGAYRVARLSRISIFSRTFHKLGGFAFADGSGAYLFDVEGHKMHIPTKNISCGMGRFEQETTAVFLNLIAGGDVVVDVGAHVGYYTLLAARKVGPEGRVFAFEPHPDNFDLLVKNINSNFYRNVIPVQKAVSNKTGKAELFLQAPSTHSLFRKNQNSNESVLVETTTLDEYFQTVEKRLRSRLKLIKMDIEGAEPQAMQGMQQILNEIGEVAIICEFEPENLKASGCDPSEFKSYLTEQGFKLQSIDKNLLCLKSRHPSHLTKPTKDRV
jgi:FkbM family methyltransferase